MNGVSDLQLAIAVHEAGAMPSLMLNHRCADKSIDVKLVNQSLTMFNEATGAVNLVYAISEEDLFNYELLKILRKHRVSHVEFVPNQIDNSKWWYDKKFTLALTYLKQTTKIITRAVSTPSHNEHVDAVAVKGSESAGFSGDISVSVLFDQQKLAMPHKATIPYGGVGSAAQVSDYLSRGAAAVAVGTLLAASKESCLSSQAKEILCKKTSADLLKFTDTHQQALMLSKVECNDGDWNRTNSLVKGLHGTNNTGHIYAGRSIDYVTEIKTVKQIINDLVQDI
jgi:NAD(P)H-dependent flavin oxidoreductase YrpB (nitropropane dioxygenase family)